MSFHLPIACAKEKVATLVVAAALLAAPVGWAGGPKTTSPGAAATGHVQPTKPAHPAHGKQTAQGVVQSVTAKAVALTQLDGTTVSVPIDRHTVLFVNGRRAELAAVKPGFVLDASWIAGKAATVLRFLRSG